jgi:UDP-galactopyranose mutase
MKQTVTQKIQLLLEPKLNEIKARLFVTRQDGITIYDSVQNQTTTSVAALVSGLWQASEALMDLVHPYNDVMEFRLGFDTSSDGIYLFPFELQGKRYFLGAIYKNCLSPGVLKRQIANLKLELSKNFENYEAKKITTQREGYLFQDITDAEIDRLFALGGV